MGSVVSPLDPDLRLQGTGEELTWELPYMLIPGVTKSHRLPLADS